MRDIQYDAKGRALHATARCVTCDVSAARRTRARPHVDGAAGFPALRRSDRRCQSKGAWSDRSGPRTCRPEISTLSSPSSKPSLKNAASNRLPARRNHIASGKLGRGLHLERASLSSFKITLTQAVKLGDVLPMGFWCPPWRCKAFLKDVRHGGPAPTDSS